ncbi:dihydroorotase [Candidatus Pseudothioglobus singularis PS1]|uniref:Dihydroorotase n=1 Tax=Candidatus Pseudothioglobus singularis PS1 TaxID=1125411 RepID=A0A0M4M1H8_9GAMM|nr:dihydroorotase [Candidatus Pseudothioglobus singularis PS1]
MSDKVQQLTITKPDDWHLHLRGGREMSSVVGMTAKQMGRAIIMPNLSPPIRTSEQALAYREEIMQALPKDTSFSPLMTLYLTDSTTQKDIINAKKEDHIYAVKYYPSGATTNSDSGVTNISKVYPVLEQMQKEGVPLLVHGEVTDSDIDIFDREKVFLDSILGHLVKNFPDLKIVLEHITTKDSVDFVTQGNTNIAATITAHHLLSNRNHMLVGGIKPHYYCLPVLKRRVPHQEALITAATSGDSKFFLGTDSAPHDKSQKESACGCAGVFSAHAAIELYAEAFDGVNKINMLEGFASYFGPDFYGLPRNSEKVTLEKAKWQIPESYDFSSSRVIPFYAGKSLSWKLKV